MIDRRICVGLWTPDRKVIWETCLAVERECVTLIDVELRGGPARSQLFVHKRGKGQAKFPIRIIGR